MRSSQQRLADSQTLRLRDGSLFFFNTPKSEPAVTNNLYSRTIRIFWSSLNSETLKQLHRRPLHQRTTSEGKHTTSRPFPNTFVSPFSTPVLMKAEFSFSTDTRERNAFQNIQRTSFQITGQKLNNARCCHRRQVTWSEFTSLFASQGKRVTAAADMRRGDGSTDLRSGGHGRRLLARHLLALDALVLLVVLLVALVRRLGVATRFLPLPVPADRDVFFRMRCGIFTICWRVARPTTLVKFRTEPRAKSHQVTNM